MDKLPSSLNLTKDNPPRPAPNLIRLSQMARGESAAIHGFSYGDGQDLISQEERRIANRLFELGLVIGETLTVSHKSAIGEHSYVVESSGILIALRKQEADMILLERGMHQ